MYMMKAIQIKGSKNYVGTNVQMLLYKKIIIPILAYNLETATNIRKKEYEEIEKLQARALQIYKMPISRHYWGMLIELGITPLHI